MYDLLDFLSSELFYFRSLLNTHVLYGLKLDNWKEGKWQINIMKLQTCITEYGTS